MKINKYLQYSIIAGLFLVLFVPLIVYTNSFFPFITGKNFAFRILVELIFGLWLILALRDASFRPKFSWLGVCALAFLVIIGVADFFSPNPLKSFWSNFERMEGYVTLLHLFAYFVVASSILNSEKRWTWFFQTSVGVSVIIGFYGILQLLGEITINQGGVRLDGTLGNAAYLGAYMMINFFIALFLTVRARKLVAWRWIYGVVIVLQLFILYYTATRGAILGLIGGLIAIFVLLTLLSSEKTFRKIGLIGLLGVALVVGVGIGLRNTTFIKNQPSLVRLTSISTSEAGPRFMVWNMAWQGFKERPILGWGQESFNYVFNKYYDPGMYRQEQWFDRTHNVLFDWLIAGGALGLLAYLSLFLFAFYYTWKQGDLGFSLRNFLARLIKFWRGDPIPYLAEKSIIAGLLVGYFFQNLFVFDNITSYILFFSILAYVHSISSWPIAGFSKERLRLEGTTVNRVLVPLVVMVTVFGVYIINAPAVRAATTLIDALRPQQGGVEKNLEYFKQALSYSSFGDPEIREQLTQAAMQAILAQSVSLTTKQSFYDLTRNELLSQLERTPDDTRYHLFLGSFLNRVRNYDEALPVLEKARQLSPKKQTVMFELGSAYINKGNMAKGLEIMKKAFELAPDFTEARVIYAVTAVYAQDFKLASELMKPLLGSSQEYDERLLAAYSSVGKIDVVASLAEKRVAQNPLDPGARFVLAGVYLNTGARQKAVEVLKYVIANFPAQKDKADYYIREIQAGRNP